MVGDKTPPEDTWKVRAELGQLYEAVLVEESFREVTLSRLPKQVG